MKLTATQAAQRIGKSVYTLKRWYKWFEDLSEVELQKLIKEGMPVLPKYETLGNTQWKFWDESDISKLQEFAEWVPKTKNGVMAGTK